MIAQAERWTGLKLRECIDADPQQRAAMVLEAASLRMDYSRQRLDASVLADLLRLAEECELPAAIEALLGGAELNASEGRAAWHTALRALQPPAPVARLVLDERAHQQRFVEQVLAGELSNAQGEAFTDVINIGIGGSDLGPRLVGRALGPQRKGLRAHFVGNLDSAALSAVLAGLDARRCLCVVVSKSFATQETRLCALAVRQWMQAQGGDVARQFVAVTAMPERAAEFGIEADKLFPMWDWVGGRYSVWSAVGLSVALTLGWESFGELLAGAEAMDRHFAEAPLAQNLPVVWALIGIWNRNFLDYPSQVTAVYSDLLEYLPDWLQQLDMESNGKSVGRDGQVLAHPCAVVQWGGVGTSVQHAFFQLLHQGQDTHPVDFVLPRHVPGADPQMQAALLGNALAQSAALSHGRAPTPEEGHTPQQAAWRTCAGDRPSSLIWLESLDARGIGALLAAYEHRCFVKGWLWGLNSFDQFGVELGKTLAQGIEQGLAGNESAWPDALLRLQAQGLKGL